MSSQGRRLGSLDRPRGAAELGEPLAVEGRDGLARVEHLVQPLELRDPDRRVQVGEPVVEPEAIVLEPVHVRRPALVALAVDVLGDLRVPEVTSIPPSPVVICLLA